MQRRVPGCRHQAAFTLLEIMLVILMIGLLSTMVLLTFGADTPQQKLEKEADRFQQLFQYVSETAMLQQQEWGLYLQADGYGFLYYRDDKWQLAEHPDGVRPHQLPEPIVLHLELEGLPGEELNLLSQLDWQLEDDDAQQQDDKDKVPALPQVFILSSGEISPFRLSFIYKEGFEPQQIIVGTDFSIPLSRFEPDNRQ
ncbi:type II secretion system minor pseudopilin GspH [Arsukibacterium sp.]|uniref:type II secretion system minor pseudopilin GspH n=1 Tax=Arsukibacterium sp. TaxID=1977258 RepID=UPI002FDB6720